jgi:hypothetical protein
MKKADEMVVTDTAEYSLTTAVSDQGNILITRLSKVHPIAVQTVAVEVAELEQIHKHYNGGD